MDFQNRVGHKQGGGGPASAQELAMDRRERLRRLALETIDLSKDPYLMRNHVGQYECRLCLTIHPNEASYLTHTQGRKHQTNLARRAAKEKSEVMVVGPSAVQTPVQPTQRKEGVKIGCPGWRVVKLRSPQGQYGLRFEIDYPDIGDPVRSPKFRFMSSYEQRAEPIDARWQYVAFAAEPYETVAFAIRNWDIDRNERGGYYWNHWDEEKKTFVLQFLFSRST